MPHQPFHLLVLILVMATGVACTARPPSLGPRSAAGRPDEEARAPVTPAPAEPTTTPPPVRFCSDGRVFIPGGTFAMGTIDDDRSGPVHEVTLSPYCLDRTEVTVQAFERCVREAGCPWGFTNGSCDVERAPDHPMGCVTWDEAARYCELAGARLPTEAEWEFAARGTDGRPFPWGQAPPRDQLCWSGVAPRDASCPVGSFASGASPFGVLDMAGNLYEWALDEYVPYSSDAARDPRIAPEPGRRKGLRGGTYAQTDLVLMHATVRYGDSPTERSRGTGIRCASDAVP